jgi:hypothetical protein
MWSSTWSAPLLTTPTVSANYKHDEIEALATPRTLTGIARFAPGVNDLVQTAGPTEGQGQVIINGGLGYDNVFMLNGVDVNDNIFGWPQNLFIEDAIAETQILTSGISAEYGRFGGGVVNAITKSGGNLFAGSYRLNLANDAWSTETPFERSRSVTRVSRLNTAHEGTFGGPIVKDRLWFFVAGRYARQETSADATGDRCAVHHDRVAISAARSRSARRSPPGHSVQGSAIGTPARADESGQLHRRTGDDRPVRPERQRAAESSPGVQLPGVGSQRWLFDAQYSHEQFSTNAGGGTDSSLWNRRSSRSTSPSSTTRRISTRRIPTSATTASSPAAPSTSGALTRSNSDTSGSEPEDRRQYALCLRLRVSDRLSWRMRTAARCSTTGASSRSFTPGDTFVFHFISTPARRLNIDHNSVNAQDHWVVSKNVSCRSRCAYRTRDDQRHGRRRRCRRRTDGAEAGVGYDLRGDGKYVVHATYGHYSGRYKRCALPLQQSRRQPERDRRRLQRPGWAGTRVHRRIRSHEVRLRRRLRVVSDRKRKLRLPI